MIRKSLSLFAVVCLVVAAVGCGKLHTLRNYENEPMPQTNAKLTEAKIKDAIVRAATAQGWKVVPEAGPNLRATKYLRDSKHMGAVKISFTDKEYSIVYADSINLKYRKGMIHPSYNTMVLELKQAVDQEIMRVQ